MNNDVIKIKSFTDLNSWKEAHKVVLEIYKLTELFPDHEKYALVNQMRRAAISMTSNIAEGFSRFSYADKSHFYSIALGSNTELQNQIYVARDLRYLNQGNFEELLLQLTIVNKLINGLIKKSKAIHNS